MLITKLQLKNFKRFTDLTIENIPKEAKLAVFRGKSADTLKIFNDFIRPLNTSLTNIFGGDTTTTIQIAEYQNPTRESNGKLIFRKGSFKINYDC
jgi:hypothetical protein